MDSYIFRFCLLGLPTSVTLFGNRSLCRCDYISGLGVGEIIQDDTPGPSVASRCPLQQGQVEEENVNDPGDGVAAVKPWMRVPGIRQELEGQGLISPREPLLLDTDSRSSMSCFCSLQL